MATLRILGSETHLPERVVRLYKRLTSVGRAAGNDVVIDDPSLPNTAMHLHFDGHDFIAAGHDGIEVWINGQKRGQSRLLNGDIISLGSIRLVFQLTDAMEQPSSSSRPPDVKAMESLVRFSERLLRATDAATLLTELLDAAIEVAHADKGFLVLADEVKAARNLGREDVSATLSRVSDSIIKRVTETGRGLVVADALHDQEWSSSSSVVNLRLCSVMCAPLTERGQVIGVLYLGNDSVVSLFNEDDLAILTIFAAQASLLLQSTLVLDSLRRDNTKLKKDLAAMIFGEIIGGSPIMLEVYRRVEKVATTDVSVLVTGETGTGKELVARELHARSTRKEKPLVIVNCGAIPENLLESELFGHVKGAFTGAATTRIGKFQAAHGGTLFLDEIGDLPFQLQVKILRALEEQVVSKVGDTNSDAVNIRIVAATNKDLATEVKRGTFREDLYYRLNVINIHLPPLRERGEDVVTLAKYYLQRYAQELGSRARSFSAGSLSLLRRYGWPGNIRELSNRIKKAVILSERSVISPDDLGLKVANLEPLLSLSDAKEAFQRRYINEVLDRNNGNRTKTAKDLEVDPRTVFRHLEKLEADTGGEVLPPLSPDPSEGI